MCFAFSIRKNSHENSSLRVTKVYFTSIERVVNFLEKGIASQQLEEEPKESVCEKLFQSIFPRANRKYFKAAIVESVTTKEEPLARCSKNQGKKSLVRGGESVYSIEAKKISSSSSSAEKALQLDNRPRLRIK